VVVVSIRNAVIIAVTAVAAETLQARKTVTAITDALRV
jgi:7-cyano-7-deazaguanine synthase in queuosine biosynthesis